MDFFILLYFRKKAEKLVINSEGVQRCPFSQDNGKHILPVFSLITANKIRF